MAGVTKGFPPTMVPGDYSRFTTVLPGALDADTSTGPRDTTALMNPMMDQWFQALAEAERQSPDEQGVTHLTLSGDPRQKNSPSLAALKGLV